MASLPGLPSTEPQLNEAGLACQLLPFQRESVRWAVTRELDGPDAFGIRGGVMAEEMGLGKTIEVLCLVLSHPPPADDPSSGAAVAGAPTASGASGAGATAPSPPLTYHMLPPLAEALLPYRERRGCLGTVEMHPALGDELDTGLASGAPCAQCGRRPSPHEAMYVGASAAGHGDNTGQGAAGRRDTGQGASAPRCLMCVLPAIPLHRRGQPAAASPGSAAGAKAGCANNFANAFTPSSASSPSVSTSASAGPGWAEGRTANAGQAQCCGGGGCASAAGAGGWNSAAAGGSAAATEGGGAPAPFPPAKRRVTFREDSSGAGLIQGAGPGAGAGVGVGAWAVAGSAVRAGAAFSLSGACVAAAAPPTPPGPLFSTTRTPLSPPSLRIRIKRPREEWYCAAASPAHACGAASGGGAVAPPAAPYPSEPAAAASRCSPANPRASPSAAAGTGIHSAGEVSGAASAEHAPAPSRYFGPQLEGYSSPRPECYSGLGCYSGPVPIGATLVVTPQHIVSQWLAEISRHAPALAARTLVYPGIKALGRGRGGAPRGGGGRGGGSGCGSAGWGEPAIDGSDTGGGHDDTSGGLDSSAGRVLRAMDGAWIVITTFKVLQAEVWYRGGGGQGGGGAGTGGAGDGVRPAVAGARRDGGPQLRGSLKYEKLQSPLMLVRWWRLVIDEAQAVQCRGATPSLLAAMAAAIPASHRWCVTGTPLSAERGLADAFDLLRFLNACSPPEATSRAAFTAALGRPTSPEGARLLRLLREMMRRTSKADVAPQLALPPPQLHLLLIQAGPAEVAWAARDVDATPAIHASALPPFPAVDGTVPRRPGPHVLGNAGGEGGGGGGDSVVGGSGDGDGEEGEQMGAGSTVGQASVNTGAVNTGNTGGWLELQRALTHAQLSRSWMSLGQAEVQIDTCTTAGPLEHLQRAAEMLARRQHREELALAERLCLLAALQRAGGRETEAAAVYERVLRVEEWGICEDASGGDQVDNAEEILRQWRCEKLHALFHLLCLHRDAGREDEAEGVRERIDATERELMQEDDLAVSRQRHRLDVAVRRMRADESRLLANEPRPSLDGARPRIDDTHPLADETRRPADEPHSLSDALRPPLSDGPGSPLVASDACAAAARGWLARRGVPATAADWLREVKKDQRAGRRRGLAELRGEREAGVGGPRGEGAAGGVLMGGGANGGLAAAGASSVLVPPPTVGWVAPDGSLCGGGFGGDGSSADEAEELDVMDLIDARDGTRVPDVSDVTDGASTRGVARGGGDAAGGGGVARGDASGGGWGGGNAAGRAGAPRWLDLAGEAAEIRRRALAAQQHAYWTAASGAALGADATAARKMEMGAAEGGEVAALREHRNRLGEADRALAKLKMDGAWGPIGAGGGTSRDTGGGMLLSPAATPGAEGAWGLISGHLARLRGTLQLRTEVAERRYALWAAEAARRSALDQAEMHKFPRALPEGRAPADALLMVEAECEHMTDACRRLDAQVRALHAHRLVELGRHRAARQPHSDDALPPIAPAPVAPAPAAATPAPPPGVPSSSSSVAAALSPGPDAPSIVTVSIRPPVPPRPSLAALHLPLFALHPDTHAAAAAASAHSCAATLCLRVALVSWLSRKRLPFACLHGTSPPANSLKLEAVSHCAQAAGLTALTSRQLVAAWLLREVPMAVAVPYDEEGEEHHGQQLQPTWAPLDGDAPPTPATPVAPPAFLVPLPTAAAAAAAAAAHAPTLAASPTPAAPSPASPFAPAPELLSLIDGTRVGFIGATEDQRQAVWDGAVMVRGKYDGEASGASFEPGPWRYDAKAGADGKGAWLRDAHPHEALILTPCGHAYSEIFWKAKLSTRIDQSARTGSWAAQRSRCCAPVPGGGTCGALLRQAGGFRMTHCNPPRSAGLHPSGGWAPLAELMRSLPVHGAIGARVEAAVRLLLALRLHAAREGLPPSEAKVVIFSRFDATLTLLTRACALNGLSCLTLSAQCGSLAAGGAVATQEAAKFCADASIQALLMSAGRSAAGLTLTAARHVLILEPQPELTTELQMIGRVHRIGQSGQAHVHRIAIWGSGEEPVARARAGRTEATGRAGHSTA